MVNKDLGMVTAYAYAVSKGYTGTEEEFAALMADYAAVGQRAEQAATAAAASATAAEGSASDSAASATAAEGFAGNASTAAGNASQSAQNASQSASAASGSATSAGQSATAAAGSATIAGNKATEAAQSATEAAASATTAESAKTAAQTAQTAAETAQTAAEDAQAAAEAAAQTLVIDPTLTQPNQAAEAKATGDAISLVKSHLEALPDDGVTANAKQLLTDKGITESVPYLFRRSGGDGADREFDTLVGGTVAWNQLTPAFTSDGWMPEGNNASVSFSDGVATIGSTVVGYGAKTNTYRSVIKDHKYFMCITAKYPSAINDVRFIQNSSSGVSLNFGIGAANTWEKKEVIRNCTASNGTSPFYVYIGGTVYSDLEVKNAMVIDLTQMLGSAIADYIYSLEQSTAGAGVAFFRSLFPADYYPYDAGTLKSVEGVSAHKTVGFNQWDEEWEVGTISVFTGENATDPSRIRSKNYVPCVPQTQYYVIDPTNRDNIRLIFYSASKEFLYANEWTGNTTFTTRSDVYYIRLITSTSYGTTYKHNICINFSDPSRNGTYEPYNGHTYALDDSLTLRGVPKLDSNNALYYDGDTYESDGTVTRKYGIVDLGTLTWTLSTQYSDETRAVWYANLSTAKGADTSRSANCIAEKYITTPSGNTLSQAGVIGIASNSIPTRVWCSTTSSSIEPSGWLVYELVTPTTEEADPFQYPQICSPYGTEEYITTGIVPVGHSTFYPENLRKKVEELPSNFSTLIAPTESTFTATRNYTTGALFIVQNVLYKATANIANGGTITPGTNCTATTLAEIISALA